MEAKKPRDRRHRTERARQERRDLLQKEKDRRRVIVEALARKRAAMEKARMATQETALASPSNRSLIPTTSNSVAPGLPSVYTAIDDMPNGGIIQSTLDGQLMPLGVPISPSLAPISLDLLEVAQQRDDFEVIATARPAARPPTPGRAFQLNQVEQGARPELVMQEQSLLMEFEERKTCELAFKHVYGSETSREDVA